MIPNLIAYLARRSANRRAVEHLSSLSDRLLRDVGLSRHEIHDVVRRGADARAG